MTNQPNRHVVCFTVTMLDDGPDGSPYSSSSWWVKVGASYDSQMSKIHSGNQDVATAALASTAAMLNKATESQDGFHRSVRYSNFKLHSWSEAPMKEVLASFGPAPMGGAENDQAWIDGPGSKAL